jgi:hypothetical protein
MDYCKIKPFPYFLASSKTPPKSDSSSSDPVVPQPEDELSDGGHGGQQPDPLGPTTRRAWSDWCSSRGGKSSKENSEDDAGQVMMRSTPTRSVSVGNRRSGGGSGPGKRKKVLRKKGNKRKVILRARNFFQWRGM